MVCPVLQDGGGGKIHVGQCHTDLAVDAVYADAAAQGGVPALAAAGGILRACDDVVTEEILGGGGLEDVPGAAYGAVDVEHVDRVLEVDAAGDAVGLVLSGVQGADGEVAVVAQDVAAVEIVNIQGGVGGTAGDGQAQARPGHVLDGTGGAVDEMVGVQPPVLGPADRGGKADLPALGVILQRRGDVWTDVRRSQVDRSRPPPPAGCPACGPKHRGRPGGRWSGRGTPGSPSRRRYPY